MEAPVWECVACTEDYITAENAPIVAEDQPYCVACIEQQLEPIAARQELVGAPKIGHIPLTEIPGLLERINPDLRRNYETNLVSWPRHSAHCGAHSLVLQARMLSAAPEQRVCCPNVVLGEICNTFLCKRVQTAKDGRHQWMPCTTCPATVCSACHAALVMLRRARPTENRTIARNRNGSQTSNRCTQVKNEGSSFNFVQRAIGASTC